MPQRSFDDVRHLLEALSIKHQSSLTTFLAMRSSGETGAYRMMKANTSLDQSRRNGSGWDKACRQKELQCAGDVMHPAKDAGLSSVDHHAKVKACLY